MVRMNRGRIRLIMDGYRSHRRDERCSTAIEAPSRVVWNVESSDKVDPS